MSGKITRKKNTTPTFFCTLSWLFWLLSRLYVYHPFHSLWPCWFCVRAYFSSRSHTSKQLSNHQCTKWIRKFSFISHNNVIKMVNLDISMKLQSKHGKIKSAPSNSVWLQDGIFWIKNMGWGRKNGRKQMKSFHNAVECYRL